MFIDIITQIIQYLKARGLLHDMIAIVIELLSVHARTNIIWSHDGQQERLQEVQDL